MCPLAIMLLTVKCYDIKVVEPTEDLTLIWPSCG